MRCFLTFLILLSYNTLASNLTDALAKAEIKQISSSLQWEKFLHYYPTLFGKQSDIDSKSFFFILSNCVLALLF